MKKLVLFSIFCFTIASSVNAQELKRNNSFGIKVDNSQSLDTLIKKSHISTGFVNLFKENDVANNASEIELAIFSCEGDIRSEAELAEVKKNIEKKGYRSASLREMLQFIIATGEMRDCFASYPLLALGTSFVDCHDSVVYPKLNTLQLGLSFTGNESSTTYFLAVKVCNYK